MLLADPDVGHGALARDLGESGLNFGAVVCSMCAGMCQQAASGMIKGGMRVVI